MASEYLMGFDIGGSNVRCLVQNIATGESVSTLRAWTHPRASDWGYWALDLDTRHLWKLLAEISKETLKKGKVSPSEIIGLATSSMRHGLVLLDEYGEVLLATPNTDARANSQLMDLASDRGEEFYQRTGHWPSPIFKASRLLWLAEHQSDTLRSVRTAFSISDWINFCLTGTLLAERSQAAESMLLDLHTGEWAEDLIRSLELPLEIFPPLENAGTHLGSLTKEAAEHLGLLPGTAVALGGADTQSGLLGLGAVHSGQLGVISGSTTPIQLVTEEAIIDERARLWTGLHIIPGLYVLESNAGAMGSSLEWFADVLYPGSANGVGRLAAEAGQAPIGANGIISSVGGAVFNASELFLPIDTLSFSPFDRKDRETTRSSFARAILEGMAYALRANIEQIQEVSNTKHDVVWMGGGMVKSQTWRWIVSEVLNARVRFGNNSETTALGAVICAGVGAGLFRDLVHGVEELTEISEEQIPKPEAVKTYQTYFQDWKSLKQERKEADLLASNFMIEFLADREHAEPTIPKMQLKPRIYVSADLDQGSVDRMKNFGEVKYASFREEEGLLVGEDLIETIDGYHVFVTEVDLVDADVLKHLPDLRVIISCRGNPVNIDIEACTAAGVVVLNTPGRNADAVADLTLSFLLMLARKMPEAIAFLHHPGGEAGDMGRMGMAYSQLQGHELWRKTLGLIGAGSVGREVIRRALPFGMRILVHDPFLSQEEILLLGAQSASLDRVLEESDFLSLHAAVTEDTRGMLNTENFAKMKPGAFLINTARAALIEEEALLQALKDGTLGGAALDVFRVEPPGSDHPLLGFPNVIATPHIGGNSYEVAAHQGTIVVDDLECLLQGAQPPHILNPEVMARFSWTGERVMMTEKLDTLAQGAGPGVSDLEVEAQKPTDRSLPSEDPSVSQPSTKVKRGVLSDREEEGKEVEMISDLSTSADLEGIRERMRRILDLFTAGIMKDEAIAKFAKGRDVVFRFTIKTLEMIFYMDYQDGLVKAGIGEPSREPDVNLKMSANTLDGMFTKRIKAMSAAMTGKLSFSGNTKKAMAFQRAQKDMQRIYQEARRIAGDPGDLSKVDALTKTSSREGSGSVRKEGRDAMSISTSRMSKVGDVRDEVLQVNNELYAKQYITPTGGNVSARADDQPDEIWITPSQIFKGKLTPEMMLRIDLEGKLVGESELSASSERRVHCAIYRTRPDVNAVIHTHAPQSTLLALAGLRFLPLSTEAAMIGDIPVVPFIMPGSDELGDAVAEALGTGVAVLMQNHGLVVAAESLRRAADITDVVEVTAEKIVACRLMGVDPPVLPDDVVETLREIGDMIA